jgi:hypothetical protein
MACASTTLSKEVSDDDKWLVAQSPCSNTPELPVWLGCMALEDTKASYASVMREFINISLGHLKMSSTVSPVN